ncbi:hypothetical protein BACCIP111883_01542 [Sutcliffiella rhizosphaerae]|uniref:ABC transporter domain-containing protein n=1 Tax=Sutcliffiella rhizosphaerae TaxID=2880967 RepID=A0ABM8YLT8_9BACI|nr:hypothetical protein BACCIP111883_01542 [Sutcliffiella rhizosphaerae]
MFEKLDTGFYLNKTCLFWESYKIIQLNNASVSYAGSSTVQALSDASLKVSTGEWVTILGPSGSGKTTLLNVISGNIPLTSGEIFVDGHNFQTFLMNSVNPFVETLVDSFISITGYLINILY